MTYGVLAALKLLGYYTLILLFSIGLIAFDIGALLAAEVLVI